MGADMFDPIDDAIYRVVHDFPPGAAQLATRVNISVLDLHNKAVPGREFKPLTVKEALAIQTAAGDVRILQAEAQTLGQFCLPVQDFSDLPDVELLSGYADWHASYGALLLSVTHALADGHVSRDEVNDLRQVLQQDAARGHALLARLEALIDEN
jgi:hypothetical protein